MKFYRYEDKLYTSGPKVIMETFVLDKETPCGYWIKPDWSGFLATTYKKWVSKTATKRYAYPTKEMAIRGFVARKKRQIAILEARAKNARTALYKAQKGEIET